MASGLHPSARRRGTCPSLWTPLSSGDGLIVRVHPGACELPARSVLRLAELAEVHGNGQIELTRRANLQLRGVRDEALPALRAALIALGLAASERAQDARRMLLVDALAGLAGCGELAGLARQIEEALARAELAEQLPEKFGIVLDAGSGLVEEVGADLRVLLRTGGVRLEVLGAGRLLGAWHCAEELAPECVRRVAQLLARELGRAGWRALPAERWTVLAAALGALLERVAGVESAEAEHGGEHKHATRRLDQVIGLQAGWFGIGIPFGSGDAQLWRAIARLAERFGAGTLRLTPRRVALLPAVVGAEVVQRARDLGLIVDPDDPLLRVEACPGAPACGAALGETRALARSLCHGVLPMLSQTATLHVSGCPKSCASSRPAALTVVHDIDGPKLGFGVDAAQAAHTAALPRERLRELLLAALDARHPGRHGHT